MNIVTKMVASSVILPALMTSWDCTVSQWQKLRAAFKEAIDDYLTTCGKLNRPPQKPNSGKLMLRVPPEVHAAVAVAAAVRGKSINQWAAETLAHATNQ